MPNRQMLVGVTLFVLSATFVAVGFQNCAQSFNPGSYTGKSQSTDCNLPTGTSWVSPTNSLSCATSAAVLIPAGGQVNVNTGAAAANVGSATYSCTNGTATLVPGSNSCAIATAQTCTVPAGTTWTDSKGVNTCTSDTAVTIAANGSSLLTDATGNVRGSATFACANGVATVSATPAAICVDTTVALTLTATSAIAEGSSSFPNMVLICPGARFVSGFMAVNGGGSDVLHSFEIVCQSFDLVGTPVNVGTALGAQSAACPSGTFAQSAQVHSGAYIDAVYMTCTPSPNSVSAGQTISVGGVGGSPSAMFSCPVGSYIYGVKFYQGANVDNIQFMCAAYP